MSTILNCSENDIRESFRQSKEKECAIGFIPAKTEHQKSTLKLLCEGSSKLLEEDKKLLKDIYGSN